jgi:hypothetical protein
MSYIVVECEMYDGKIILPRILNQTDKTKYFCCCLLFSTSFYSIVSKLLVERGYKFMHEGMPTLAIHPSILTFFHEIEILYHKFMYLLVLNKCTYFIREVIVLYQVLEKSTSSPFVHVC